MRFFPKVQSPCPYKGALSDIMDGSTCRLCQRQVHDITDMAEDAKRALLADCVDEVCVSYRIDTRRAVAAAALGAGVMLPLPLAAQDAADDILYEEDYVIIVGGMREPQQAKWIAEDDVREGRELPVEYAEDSAEG